MTLPELLRWLDREDVLLTAEGDRLKWNAPCPPSGELRDEILRHRAELIDLFRDPPTWPPACGRSGPLESWSHVVGDTVQLPDGHEGRLRVVLYDTRSGRLRCRVELPDGRARLLDPEDVLPGCGDRRAGEGICMSGIGPPAASHAKESGLLKAGREHAEQPGTGTASTPNA